MPMSVIKAPMSFLEKFMANLRFKQFFDRK